MTFTLDSNADSVTVNVLNSKRLRELLTYHPEKGFFTWNIGRSGKLSGDIAGGSHSEGYVHISVDGKLYLAHRLAWLYVHGVWPKDQIDHIDGNKSNNRICNLRDVSNGTNQENQIFAQKNNKSGFLGVSKKRKKYVAQIMINGKKMHLGYFNFPEQAHSAYLAVKRKFHFGCTI